MQTENQLNSKTLIEPDIQLFENKERGIVGTEFNEIKPTQDIINRERVDFFKSKLLKGEKLEPVTVYKNEKGTFLQEGHHRFVASKETGIPVEIIEDSSSGPVGLQDWTEVKWKTYKSEEQFWGE